MPDFPLEGVTYHVEEHGAGRPLVLLHGFTGSARSWQHLIPHLATNRRVVAIDLLGHAQTGAPRDHSCYAFERGLDDLAAIARELRLGDAVWVGYSMGGRVALAFAIEHAPLVSGLILESASPGLEDPVARVERQQSDELLAQVIERESIASFVADWERLPLWDSQRGLPEVVRSQQRAIRLRNSPNGLAGSLRGMGTGSQPSYWGRLPDLRVPTLLIAGSLDTKFSGIATEMSVALPNARLEIIPDAGHAIHLEQPERYLQRVTEFMHEVSNSTIVTREEVA